MKRTIFPTIIVLLVTLTVFAQSVAAKDAWTQIRTKNFNLIGNASEKDIRKVATKLEQFREAFRSLFTQTDLSSPIPTNVVVFKSDSSYKPFKPKRADGKIDNFVAGYFQPGEDVNYITLSTDGQDADMYGTIFHEYVHFIVNTNFGKSEVPPWFNEGLAEYYQTFAIEEDIKVKLGLPQENHLALLQQTRLIPLDTLFKISNYALHQNGSHSRSIFYAQSWALIHYFIANKKTEGLSKFLTLSMRNVAPEKAFEEAFQITYAEMEKLLKKYVGQSSYVGTAVTFKNKVIFDADMQISTLSESDTNAYLGDLLYHTNRADDAEPYLRTALELDPDSSMANTALGMVKVRQRKYDDAKVSLEKAISKDKKNHLAFYQYAYLISRESRDEFGYVQSFPADRMAKMREMLKKAIEIKPAFTESYELLAFISLVNRENLDEAVAMLKTALKHQPGNQKYAMRIAEIYMRQDKFADAEAIAKKIAETSDEPETKQNAENLVAELMQRRDMLERNEAARKQFEEAGGRGSGPMLIRRGSREKEPTPEEEAKIRAELALRSINKSLRELQPDEKRVIGTLQKIECKGDVVTYHVKTADENFTLSSKDFSALTLTTFIIDGDQSEVGCASNVAGQKSVLTYKPNAAAKAPKRGELLAIEFVPEAFRIMEKAELEKDMTFFSAPPQTEARTQTGPPPPATDFEEQRRKMMLANIAEALRKPEAGEKREMAFLQGSECTSKAFFFLFKTPSQTLKLLNLSMGALYIRGFTPEIRDVQFGCGMKPLEMPVIVTFKEAFDKKTKSNGEVVALEFVPKSFVLE